MKKLIILFLFLSTILCGQNMNIVWQQCYGTITGDDSPDFVYKTNGGYFIATNISREEPGISNYHGGGDAWLVFTDTNHIVQWERCYGGSGSDSFLKILPDNNNNFWILGGTNSSDGDIQSLNHDSYDLWLLKIDSVGEILFEKCYGSFIFDSPMDIVVMPDGGAMMLASIDGSGGDISLHYGTTDGWICRVDSTGNIVWENTFGNESKNEFMSITTTSENTYLLAGWTYTCGGMVTCDVDSLDSFKDCWLVEIDQNGNILWQDCYGGSYHEQAVSVTEVPDGYIVAGLTNSNDIDVSGLHGVVGYYHDIWIYKINKSKEFVWQNCLGGSIEEYPSRIFNTSDSCFYIMGNTSSNDGDVSGLHGQEVTDNDIWIIKLDWNGNLQSQNCYGSDGFERISYHNISKVTDYDYLISAENRYMNGDVECHLNPNPLMGRDNWVFQLKDCQHYASGIPNMPQGSDTLCVNTDSITTYTTEPATNAWYYEWQLQPEEAGIVQNDNALTISVKWNPNYEGPAMLKVRSSNDCGDSEWSDSLIIQTYTCLGTEENGFTNSLHVYPNPATSTIIVEMNLQIQNTGLLEVYNSTGLRVFSEKTVNKTSAIDVSNWSKGIYVVKISSENVFATKKLIVN